jgi:hypothetical protein
MEFDIIFVDGLHYGEQVERDIINSLNVLRDGGYIVCHDMMPLREEHQVRPQPDSPPTKPNKQKASSTWTGDCWKAWVKLRSERNDLEMVVVDADWGCGIITKGQQTPINLTKDLTWENLVEEREYWMNIITEEEFKNKYI